MFLRFAIILQQTSKKCSLKIKGTLKIAIFKKKSFDRFINRQM